MNNIEINEDQSMPAPIFCSNIEDFIKLRT